MIHVNDLHKSFGAKQVLRGIEIEIGTAETFVIVGGSGQGKSVFLKHLIGLLKPDRGEVLIDGQSMSGANGPALYTLRRDFGMSFQEGALFDSMTVFDNIAFPIRRHTQKSRLEIAERVEHCLDLVKLEGVGEKRPNELSGGMRRRVGFARAIALEPKILLFDEPTTGLDPINTAIIGEIIASMSDELHATSVTITHDLDLAFGIGDRVAMIREGQFLLVATPDEFQATTNPYIRAFLEGRVPPEGA